MADVELPIAYAVAVVLTLFLLLDCFLELPSMASWIKSLWKRETPRAWSKADCVIPKLADDLLACLLILNVDGRMSL